MTLVEGDLLSALKGLYEASKVMTSGQVTSAYDMGRYHTLKVHNLLDTV